MQRNNSKPDVSLRHFGILPSGAAAALYTLVNRKGIQAKITNYGGIVTSLLIPDSDGTLADVVLGYDTLDSYYQDRQYMGAIIGRYANRIAGSRFTLAGQTYNVSNNEGGNSLHGGLIGFGKVLWTAAQARVTEEGPQLSLEYISREGEEGYPGALAVVATYTLVTAGLRLTLTATTTEATIVSLTGHSYFNLAARGSVLGHEVQIASSHFTPVGADQIPTGELRTVQGTPFDFRARRSIGAQIYGQDEQLRISGGYDHNWMLNAPVGPLRFGALAYEPGCGRVLEILTDQPGLQFYSGNFLAGTPPGRGGRPYRPHDGFCFEPQQFPNAPNEPAFPSPVLLPGNQYRCTILYRFSAARMSRRPVDRA